MDKNFTLKMTPPHFQIVKNKFSQIRNIKSDFFGLICTKNAIVGQIWSIFFHLKIFWIQPLNGEGSSYESNSIVWSVKALEKDLELILISLKGSFKSNKLISENLVLGGISLLIFCIVVYICKFATV